MSKSKLAFRTLLFMGFWFITGLHQLGAQCIFNCNDTIHVSVNNMCMANITPDMILEGVDTIPQGCVYGIELFNEAGAKINTSPKLGAQYIGQYIKVRIFQKNGNPQNSCWGYVLLEDKLPPEIVCPPNDTVKCYVEDYIPEMGEEKLNSFLKSKIESNLIDNCGSEEISINIISNTLDKSCTGPFAAVQIVTYDALDKSLNATRCVDTIYYERLPFADVNPPKDYKGNASLKCYGNWDKDNDGLPSVAELMLLDGNFSKPNVNGKDVRDYLLCNFKLTSNDVTFPDCGNTFKLVRTWTVIDWCNASVPKFYYQVIKVIDDRIIATFPSDINNVVANPWTCDQQVSLPAPIVSADECSNWSWSIFIREPGDTDFSAFGGSRSMNTSSVSRVFPTGKSTVQYVIKDICKNERIDSFCVVVVDQDDPIAVCDHRTVVTLNDQYLGKVFANTFDDNSFDGCSDITSYKVRRTDRATTGCLTPAGYDDFVKFCCEDLGKTIMVELQVTDETGRTSVCMAEVRVQFKGPGPNITCPPDVGTQDCRTYDNFNINALQKPGISSTNPCLANSLGIIVRERGRQIDECGNGYIDVEWVANFTGTEQVICSDRIVFSNLDLFNKTDITWPSDRSLTTCTSLDPTPSEINNLFDPDRPCSNIYVTHEDDVFDNVSGFCKKVLRTWTVIDWCQFNSGTHVPTGLWSHVQKIHITSSDDPVFDLIPGIIDIQDDQNNCRANVKATGQASDDCTEKNKLIWTHKLDVLFGNTSIPIIPRTAGRSFQRNLDIGTYIVTWEVSDLCGNKVSRTQSFEVADTQDPTPICKSGGGNLSFVNGELTVIASQLNGGSTDNCDGDLAYTVRRAGSASTPAPGITFTCADVGIQELELWVTDNAGNAAYCPVFYEVRDGNNTCGVAGASLMVGGMILSVHDQAIEEAEVRLQNDAGLPDQKQMTPVSGEYAFEHIEGHQNYSLLAQKNDDYTNGVSTLDMILLQQHILGLKPFDSPYKYIAGDASNDTRITSIDLVLLRRLILGQIAKLPNNASWRFIGKDHPFPNPTHPWPLQTHIDIENVDANMVQNDFVGIKIGDLDQNAVANSLMAKSRSDQEMYLKSFTEKVSNNQLNVSLYLTEDMALTGMQAAFSYDATKLEFVGIVSDQIRIDNGTYIAANGTIKLSWIEAHGMHAKSSAPLMSLVFRNLNQDVHDHSIGLSPWENEIYDAHLNAFAFHIEEIDGSLDDVVLYQNKPNPFTEETTIEFYLPESSPAQLEIFDLNGKKVYDHIDYSAGEGNRRVVLNRSDMGLSRGIYYYQLTTSRGTLARKMIIM